MGDRILKVNETNVTTATHQDAVMELLRPGDEIKLTIQHDPLPVGFQVSTTSRKYCGPFFSCLSFFWSHSKREKAKMRVHSSQCEW